MWIAFGLAVWFVAGFPIGMAVGRHFARRENGSPEGEA